MNTNTSKGGMSPVQAVSMLQSGLKSYLDFVSINLHCFDHEVYSNCSHLAWREEPL